MHFFNPAPVMELVEVIAGVRLLAARRSRSRAPPGEAMGTRVIDADRRPRLPGQPLRPALRPRGAAAAAGALADVETIDRDRAGRRAFAWARSSCRTSSGIDVGLEVSQSFYELSFGEPRWRPSPLSARMVAAGRLGRKSGRGWYAYDDASDRRGPDAAPAPPGGGDGGAWS